MSYPAYPEVKPSGVEWFDKLPEDWQPMCLKYLLRKKITDGPHATPTFLDDGVPFLSVDGIQDGELVFEGCRFVSEEDHASYKVKALPERGDILLGKAASTGKVARVKVDFEFSIWSPLALIKPNKASVDAAFLEYAFKSQASQAQVDVLCTSNTQKNISMDDIPTVIFALPPLPEQQQIAAFLDRKTAELDAVLALKERQLELLAEKRQALISQAVTRGLDPAAPLKPSGIVWLGDVPGHWEVKRLKFLKSGSLMYGANEAAESDNPNMPRFIRITDLKDDGTLREDTFRSLPEDLAAPFMLEDGDFLFARSGATVGKAFMYSKSWGPACFAGYLIRLRPQRKVLVPDFLNFYIQSAGYEGAVKEVSIQSTIQNVSAEKYANFTTPLPPLVEQQAIVAYLKKETANLNGVAQAIRAQIDKVREYRQALISAAVTGKIDVRGMAMEAEA